MALTAFNADHVAFSTVASGRSDSVFPARRRALWLAGGLIPLALILFCPPAG
jgi:hypothetical protein